MKYRFIIVWLLPLVLQPISQAQTVAGFENYGLQPGQYINNAEPTSYFSSGSIELPNFFDPEFNFWSGWAISAANDNVTPGFLNQYSSIAGRGALGSTAFAVGYVYDPVTIRLKPEAAGKAVIGFYVSNSSYTYYSMRDGDFFSKKFGGETGNDPDFFKLTIQKYYGGALHDHKIEVFLADYRFTQPELDYILSDWIYVDLAILGEVDSLLLSLTSSDEGLFGMNTPAYICVDEISTDNLLAAEAPEQHHIGFQVTPNPAEGYVWFSLSKSGVVSLVNLAGREVWRKQFSEGQHQADISQLPSGIYHVLVDGLFRSKVMLE